MNDSIIENSDLGWNLPRKTLDLCKIVATYVLPLCLPEHKSLCFKMLISLSKVRKAKYFSLQKFLKEECLSVVVFLSKEKKNQFKLLLFSVSVDSGP